MALIHPTWDYTGTTENDRKIWVRLFNHVRRSNVGEKNEAVARPLLINFMRFEMEKDNSISVKRYMEQSTRDRDPVPVIFQVGGTDVTCVAPFAVPEDGNDDYSIKPSAHYNFSVLGKTFNGKTVGDVNGKTIAFRKDSITMLVATGNYRNKIGRCFVVDKKDRMGNPAFTFGRLGSTEVVIIPRDDIHIIQNELLRSYFKFLRWVNEAFRLDPTDCHSDERMIEILDHLGRLFVDSKLDITGHPWRRVRMSTKNSTPVVPSPRRKPPKPPLQPEQPYDLKDIDEERIALDALMWTKREFGNQHKRTDPSIYDAFEALGIDKTVPLEVALGRLIQRLGNRKAAGAHPWEPRLFTFYGVKANRTRMDIWESALVNCLHANTPDAFLGAIIDHIFLNPTLQDGRNRYSNANIFQSGALNDFKSSAYESFDHEIAQNFATHMRANQDSNNYLMLLRLPWPETKKLLRKQPQRNRYYPEAFVEARYPEMFYLRLKEEHEACHRLRKIAYALSLSREKGYPVISRRQVVAPDSFHTDYNTLPLPRVVSIDRDTGAYDGRSPDGTLPEDEREYWGGHNPGLIKEFGREARFADDAPQIYMQPKSKHPLYPSQIKADFDP